MSGILFVQSDDFTAALHAAQAVSSSLPHHLGLLCMPPDATCLLADPAACVQSHQQLRW